MTFTDIIIVSTLVIMFLVVTLFLSEPLKRKIEKYKFKYKFKKKCQRYTKNKPLDPTPEQIKQWGRNFESLKHSRDIYACNAGSNYYSSGGFFKFKRGELKELVLKHIKNRKGITIIQLGVLIPGAKENSIRKSIASLKRDGVIESRRLRKTKYVQYFLKKDVDAVGDK